MPNTKAKITPIALAEKLHALAIAHGAEKADAMCIRQDGVSVSVRKGTLEGIERSESFGVGLRVFVGKKSAAVSSSELKKEVLTQLVERAVAMARTAPEDPYIALAEKGQLETSPPDLDLCDAYSPDEAVLKQQALQVEEAALAEKGITNTEGAEASTGRYQLALVTSAGFKGHYESSNHGFSVSVLAGEGTGMERDYAYSSARFFDALKAPEAIGKEAAERTLKRLNPRRPKTGQVPLVFDPRVSKSLVGTLAAAANGASVARGTSFLKGDMGKELFGKHIQIINDPYRKRGLASRPFDGEGVKSSKLHLIENGVLTNWLLDIRSANQLGLTSNGCASRGLASAPSPGTANLYMENGTLSPQELLSDIKSGLYITETFGMGINLVTGDYSQGAVGFWIENGELAYPVSELTIAGNLRAMFRQLTPANDLAFTYGTNAPTLRVEGMTVAGT